VVHRFVDVRDEGVRDEQVVDGDDLLSVVDLRAVDPGARRVVTRELALPISGNCADLPFAI
jgi:hypothetical protein